MTNNNEDKKREIAGIYEELKGVLDAMKSDGTWFDDNGFAAHANLIIGRISHVCPNIQDINSYKVQTEYSSGRSGNIVNTIPTKARLKSIIGRLKGEYDLDMTPVENSGHTFIQNQSQSQSQTQGMVLELQERILSEIPKHPTGSKERNFLEKIKSVLPSMKTGTDVLSNILKIALEIGIHSADVLKLLHLQ